LKVIQGAAIGLLLEGLSGMFLTKKSFINSAAFFEKKCTHLDISCDKGSTGNGTKDPFDLDLVL